MTAAVGASAVVVVALIGCALRPRRPARAPVPTGSPRALGRGRGRGRIVDRAYPDVLDLFVITVQAGFSPAEAIRALAPVVDPSIGTALSQIVARIDHGERFADALSSLTDALGPRGSTFVDTLSSTERAGLPVAPAIDRLADDARQHRRRVAEADARQLPVRLSFPLVLCTLTSFVLVAIVPLLLGALTSFDRSSP